MVNEEFLKRENEMLNRHKGELIEKVWFLESENKRLREALEFYANEEDYEDNITTTYGYTCAIAFDEGETARKALKG